jgi:hypothetical protein
MKIRFRVDYTDYGSKPELNISIKADKIEIDDIYKAIASEVEGCKPLAHLSHAFGIMTGKEDLEIKDET